MRYLSILIILWACTDNLKTKDSITSTSNIKESVYSNVVFKNNDGTFGYDIFNDSKLIIRQKTMPAKSGFTGFSDSMKAAKVAEFAISKIETGMFPPTIQETEIDSIIKIKYQ